jgi:hypothetical protein
VYDISKMDSQEVTQSKLNIETTTRTGTVACEAINREGVDEQRVDIKIRGPGSPPKNIRPSTVENGFKVEWEPPEHPNGEITGCAERKRNSIVTF